MFAHLLCPCKVVTALNGQVSNLELKREIELIQHHPVFEERSRSPQLASIPDHL